MRKQYIREDPAASRGKSEDLRIALTLLREYTLLHGEMEGYSP